MIVKRETEKANWGIVFASSNPVCTTDMKPS